MCPLALCLLSAGLIGSQAPEPDAVTPLVAALRVPDVEIRAYSAAALATLGPPAVDPVLKLLTDKDRVARAGAAYALGQLGAIAKLAKPALLKALKDEDRDVRRQAAYALSKVLAAEREQITVPPIAPPPVFPAEPPH